MNKPTYYITTAIYYPNSDLHIGHAYEAVATDAAARYKRLRGYDVRFMTGTDEFGKKIEEEATKQGKTPQQLVDHFSQSAKEVFDALDVSYDVFWRTTDPRHVAAVQKIFNKLYENGDIYKHSYEGPYCTPCEAFYTASQAKEAEGKCTTCGRDLTQISEEAYFFKMSKYQDRLIKHIEDNPSFIRPASRALEMLNGFLRPGLEDLCVSRSTFKWGVPVSFDPDHVTYVWVDALSNYITGLGYGSDDDADFKKYWPADVHILGKDVVRFHTIIWPAILMALGEELPKQVFGHGWINVDGKKMGKSLGNAINPMELTDTYGVDAIRFFLLREISFGQDGNYTTEILINRLNSDLANDLGNLLSRTVGMIDKYFGGTLPSVQAPTPHDDDLITLAKATAPKAEAHYDALEFDKALDAIWALIGHSNKYIDLVEPWKLAKEEDKQDMLAGSLYNLVEVLRIVAILIEPVMPSTPAKIYAQLNITGNTNWGDASHFGLAPKEVQVAKGDAMFPRIEKGVK
ncbi:MAG: methionine--tRNA ligase [Defluviitaleaceae bacterium]|nr:methionine--tRNA ligase [Defluviitaleaceae bacterium]